MNIRTLALASAASSAIALVACGSPEPKAFAKAPVTASDATPVAVLDSVIAATQDADGVAAPFQQAMVSTKLMGAVTEVMVREGDLVSAGQALARIDARDVDAKGAQVAASVAAAEAAQANAAVQLKRIRALYADSAAPKAMLDAAELGFAQADAGVRAAKGAAAEVASVKDYAVVKAPFAGMVTKRFVDAGAFAAPGAPIVQIQDASRLRVTVTAPPEAAHLAKRGATIDALIDGKPATATIEGIVPSLAGGVYSINAIAANAGNTLASGGAATLLIPSGTRHAMLVPTAAIVKNGDLTGVRVRKAGVDDLRWVRIGHTVGRYTEVLSGLSASEEVLVTTARAK
jgi:RND family efflux transporter MFP subunit